MWRTLISTVIQIIFYSIPVRGKQRSGILTMNTFIGQLVRAHACGPAGSVAGMADFNNDGHPDYLLLQSQPRGRQRYGILTITFTSATRSGPRFLARLELWSRLERPLAALQKVSSPLVVNRARSRTPRAQKAFRKKSQFR